MGEAFNGRQRPEIAGTAAPVGVKPSNTLQAKSRPARVSVVDTLLSSHQSCLTSVITLVVTHHYLSLSCLDFSSTRNEQDRRNTSCCEKFLTPCRFLPCFRLEEVLFV
ncbi:hypothetical protein J6590_002700 [Homalodisca vitripennis]|nr:hypothetical protein J6590_002700 [Homalodisca vitripennis]